MVTVYAHHFFVCAYYGAIFVEEITYFTDLDVELAHRREVMILDMYYSPTCFN